MNHLRKLSGFRAGRVMRPALVCAALLAATAPLAPVSASAGIATTARSEEHTSELQSH